MLASFANAFKVPELRGKILFTIAILALYRLGAYIPVPGIPFHAFADAFQGNGVAMVMLDLFTGGALSNFSVFALGIMPYITASIIMQLMGTVIPRVAEWRKAGEPGRKKITQCTRWLTLVLGLINAVGYLLLFKSQAYGVVFNPQVPSLASDAIVVFTLVAGTAFIMWMGELITQKGVGNGMSLIIFTSIVAGIPSAILSSTQTASSDSAMGVATTVMIIAVILACIPLITFIERAQRRIPIHFSKRVAGSRVVGGQKSYIPMKVNMSGVIAIIFASCLIYFPAQIASMFNIGWLTNVSNALASGPVNWVATALLVVFFSFFYNSIVFNPEDTAENLHKQGGFIPGIRPGAPTVDYIRRVSPRITLPGALYVAAIAVVPSILFFYSGNELIQAFGGTSILIMIGVALDTMARVESQLEMHSYDGFFK